MGAYKHLNNSVVNLAKGKELSLKRQGSFAQATWVSRSSDMGLSLKQKAFA